MPVERSPLWDQLPAVVEPTSGQLDEIRRGVEERIQRRAAQRRRRLRLIPGLIVGLGILWWFLAWRAPPLESGSRGAGLLASRGSAASLRAEAPAVPQTSASPVGPDSLAVTQAPLRELPVAPVPAAIQSSHRTASPAPRSPARFEAEDPEASLLGSALKQLRREHNPQGALSVLKSYRREFPAGVLRPEAVLVEAESLVMLGRHQELVNLLTPEAVSGLPRSTELSLLRAEALSHLDRCREAIAVFSSLLSISPEDEPAIDSRLRERALFGRALCRAHVGQVEAARRDLELEVAQFPDEAAKARQTLKSLPGP